MRVRGDEGQFQLCQTLHSYNWAVACDFQQSGILKSVDSDEHVQPPFKLQPPKDVQSLYSVYTIQSNTHRIFKRQAKALIRLRVCAGWSEALLVTQKTLLEISCTGLYWKCSQTHEHWIEAYIFCSLFILWGYFLMLVTSTTKSNFDG